MLHLEAVWGLGTRAGSVVGVSVTFGLWFAYQRDHRLTGVATRHGQGPVLIKGVLLVIANVLLAGLW